MNPKKQQPAKTASFFDGVRKSSLSPLEAFLGNGLFYDKGVSAMDKGQYKTVKEVCALTGLTGKHLYYFHHENVVRAVAYANYSVEGNDGYKLYDDAAVEKLQQIALFYQLGLKRNEIRDLMLAPDYDSNLVLKTLLEMERAKETRIERHIAALEYLELVGIKHGNAGGLRGISLEELGQALLSWKEIHLPENADRIPIETFERDLAGLISELGALTEEGLHSRQGAETIGKLFDLGRQYLGQGGPPFILTLFLSVLGEGELAQAIHGRITDTQVRAVIRYVADHPELYEKCSEYVMP